MVWVPSPKQAVIGILAAIGLMALLVLVGNPAGLAPGMAESKVDGSEIVLTFHDGDHYFWLPAKTAQPMAVSQLAGDLEGDQTIIGRQELNSVDRQVYQESKDGPDDFELQPDHIYQVSGVRDDAELRYAATPATAGKDYAEEIVASSTSFLKRLWLHVKELPGTIWGQLLNIVAESRDLFSKHTVESTDGTTAVERGQGLQAMDYLRKLAPHVAVVGALFLVASLLGFDTVMIGFASGLYLLFAGYWPFGILVAAAGLIFDNNAGGQNLAQRVMGLTADGAVQFGDDFPRVVGALLFYGFGFLVGLVGLFLDRPGIAVASMAAGALLGTAIVFDGARSSTRKVRIANLAETSPYQVRRVTLPNGETHVVRSTVATWRPHLPAYAITGMGVANTILFAWWGYTSIAVWTLTATATFMALYIHWFWNAKKYEDRGKSYDPVNIRSAVASRRRKAWQEMGVWSKAGVWTTIIVTYLTVGALVSRDYLAAVSYLVMAMPLLAWMLFLVPNRIKDYAVERFGEEALPSKEKLKTWIDGEPEGEQ